VTTSKPSATQPGDAFVWVWLPGATDPVVAGLLEARGSIVTFTYGRSYLDRPDAISLYEPELPLRAGRIEPRAGLSIASCIRDAGPDAWGQRVILARRTGTSTADADTADLDPLTYLLESGSDRIGALDFQSSPTEYLPRTETAPLAALQQAATALQEGRLLPEPVATAFLRGTSVGGARPKVLLTEDGRHWIAKLSSTGDPYPVVKAEAVDMELARRVGLHVPATQVIRSLDRDVLLVERFDRPAAGGQRRLLVSALTILGLDEMMARYATYPDLADAVRSMFTNPDATLRELFSRIVFNVCIGNTDDHARNHAAFWDGRQLELTPAYDLCPQPRSGEEAAQAMAIGREGQRASQLQVCLDSAAVYHLDRAEAGAIIDHQLTVITEQWEKAADAAQLTEVERRQLWGRQILNPFIHYGYPSQAVLEQVGRNARARGELAREFGLLSGADVAALAESDPPRASAVTSSWTAEGKVFTTGAAGDPRFPGFQFGDDGRPLPVIAEVLTALGGRLSGWELALWFTGGNGWLGGSRPVDVLDSDPELVVQAAGHLAADLLG